MAERTCSIEGCERPHQARGWCKLHYERWRKHGSLERGRGVAGPPCVVEDCDTPSIKRGMCSRHYQRWRTKGDPLAGGTYRITGDDEARFMAKIDRTGPPAKNNPELGPCWIWTASCGTFGYGQFMFEGRPWAAHRWAYIHFVGPVPDGLVLDHFACDNGAGGCANPHHVRPVTNRENVLRTDSPSAVNARKTHCIHGHEFTPENTYHPPSHPDRRACRTCIKERTRRLAKSK